MWNIFKQCIRPQSLMRPTFVSSVTQIVSIIIFLNVITIPTKANSQELERKQVSFFNGNNTDVIQIKIINHDLLLLINEEKNISFTVSGLAHGYLSTLELLLISSDNNIQPNITNISVPIYNYTQENQVLIKPVLNGHALLVLNTIYTNMTDTSESFVRLSVHYSASLDIFSNIVGWAYFIAWSISFYPQIYLNWKRKSVIGLHFDFLTLNVLGFLVYSIFNIGLYYVSEIKSEYFHIHPYGVNPVQLNDVIFSVHALCACIILILQCIIYERGDQKISRTARSLLGTFIISSLVMLILGLTSVILWINFLYFLSFIKLFITLIKYIPQAYYNFLRKSTSGWSIGNIILDFTGGSLSICQMLILAFNYNDWSSIFGDLTKFGLGIFSIMFDIFFMVQHYILYKDKEDYVNLAEASIGASSNFADSQVQASYGSIKDTNQSD
ncbi:UNVERIFIED_CONTAM: hypothetical protein GTU68_056565 [Idotea baltica]|nr:hypothetical protein [Idotea baltica]